MFLYGIKDVRDGLTQKIFVPPVSTQKVPTVFKAKFYCLRFSTVTLDNWIQVSNIQIIGSCLMLSHFSRVRLFVTSWTAAYQALSKRFPRQAYWSGLPFPPPGNLPNPGTEPMSPVLTGRFFSTEPPGKPSIGLICL